MIAGEKEVALSVANVQETTQKMLQNPGLVKALVDKFTNQVGLLGNLAMIEDNRPIIAKVGGVDALIQAFEVAKKAPKGVKREKAIVATCTGILRMSDMDECAEQFLLAGMPAKIMAAAIKYPENSELSDIACAMMGKMMENPAHVRTLCNPENLANIIQMAQVHSSNKAILANVLDTLGKMAVDESTCKEIIRLGGADIAVESIYVNMEDPIALKNGLNALAQLGVDDDAVQSLLTAGAVDAILQAMRRYPHNQEIIGSSIQGLCRLLVSEAIAQDIGEKGAVALLVKAMRDHYRNEAICEIDAILMDSLSSVKENAERFLKPELKTVELIQWVDEAYPNNTAIHEAAQRLLATLCPPEEPELEVLEGDTRLDAEQADQIIAQLRSGELTDNQIQMLCQNITDLCQTPENAILMVQRGGMQALAAVMKENKDNEDIYYAAASAFATLAENGGDAALALLEDPALMEAMCEIMKPRPEFATPMNMNDLARAIGACAKMKLGQEVLNELLKNAPLQSLMKIMCESDDPLLLTQAARLLGKLSNDDDASGLLAQITNISELIAAMRRNMANEEFLKYGVYLLGNLASDDKLKEQIGILGGIMVILEVMERYPNNDALIENCCYTLAQLSWDSDVNCSFIVACKGVKRLIDTMQTHPNKETLLDNAVCVLCNLCHNNDNNKEAIVKAGGATIIVEAVLNNFDSIDLLLTCFRTLGNLAYTTDSVHHLIDAGAVQGVVAGMTVHEQELDLIGLAVQVLSALATDLDAEHREIMYREGAVQAIVEVAANYTQNLEMETLALGCLHGLASEMYNAKMIIKQSGTSVTLKACAILARDDELVENGMSLLYALSRCKEELGRMHESGVTQGIVNALKDHKKHPGIVYAGASAIKNLSYNEKIAATMAEFRPIQLVLKLILMHQKDSHTLVALYNALSGLSRDANNAELMAESAMNRMSSSLDRHSEEAFFCKSGFHFLSNLCTTSSAAESVPKTPIVQAILKCLKLHSDPGTLIRGLRALENMAYCDNMDVRNHMKENGVINDCEKIKKSTDRDDVKEAAQGVIDAINKIMIQDSELKIIDIGPVKTDKSAAAIFEEKEKAPELDQRIKNFLTAGMLVVIHTKKDAKKCHLYVTVDLKTLIHKHNKAKSIDDSMKMKTIQLRSVEKGRCCAELSKKKFGKYSAKEECVLAVQGSKESIYMETKTKKELDDWAEAFEALIRYQKKMKELASHFDTATASSW